MARVKKSLEGMFATIKEFTFLLFIVFLIRTFGFGLYQVPTGSMETTMLVGERFFADKFTPLFRPIKRGDIISFNDPTYDYSHNTLVNIFQNYVWGPSNWTKRVVGIPGDTVRGVIENDKPVVYLNGRRLDEPYINKYPLIYMCKESPVLLRRRVDRYLDQKGVLRADRDEMLEALLGGACTPRSYDESLAYDKQIFYKIQEELVIKTRDGKPKLLRPGTPLKTYRKERDPSEKNYWDGSDIFYVELGNNQYWLMGDNRLGSKDCRFFGPVSGKLIHGKIIWRIWSIDSDASWWFIDLFKHPVDFWRRVRWSRFFQRVH